MHNEQDEEYFDQYVLDPPETCWVCGIEIDDSRNCKRYIGHTVCRHCYNSKTE